MPTNHHCPARPGSVMLYLPGQARRARTVISRSGAGVRVKFSGRKTCRSIHCEGLLERDACILFEAITQVLAYTEQPCSIYYNDGQGGRRRYTPDFRLTLNNGSTFLVEVKDSATLARPEIQQKLDRVTAHFARAGETLVVLDESTIRNEPRLTNLRRIAWQAPHPLPYAARYRQALRLAGVSSSTTLADAKRILARHHLDPYGAMLRGVLRFDLNAPLQPATSLLITREDDHAWFCIAPRYGF